MKARSAAATAAMADGTAIASAAIKIACSPSVLVWGGYGSLALSSGSAGSQETYLGIGDRGLVSVTGAALGDSEQNLTLSLSGVEPDVLVLWNASEVQGAACQIWLLTFDTSGTQLLDAEIYTAGRLDTIGIQDVVGGTSTITASVETAARGLGRNGSRMRTDADQRLIDPNDGAYHVVSFAGSKTLYWGGQKPTSASTLGWTPIATGTNIGGYIGSF